MVFRNLILITSVINTPNKNLSYGIRSVFKPDVRFNQLKMTIQSLKRIPDSKIFLTECSKIENYMESYLKENTDYFLNLYDKIDVEKYSFY